MTTTWQTSNARLRALSMAFTIVLLPALAAAPSAQAQTYRVLYNFAGGSDASGPFFGALVQDKAGNLYGTTPLGGASGNGAVFKVTKSGTETVLYSFTGGADGAFPTAGLVLSGNTLYGTAVIGGSGYGVVFGVNTETGAETVLYAFTGGADGANPETSLVRDKKGKLYGTATYGGSAPGTSGYGVVFELVKGKETVLHTFAYSDGAYPECGLLQDSKGNLYGTAGAGGSTGNGVVWEVTP